MSSPSLEDLFTTSTRDEVLAELLDIGTTLELPTTSWRVGGVTRIILKIVSQKFSDLISVMVLIAKGGLLDYATKGWLTLLARSVYNVERRLSSAATGELTLTNSSEVLVTYAAGEVHFGNAVTGRTYNNAEDINVAAGGTQTLDIVADVPGAASSAGAGEITVMVSAISGVACSNAASVVGLDEETDPELRQTCREKLAALSPNGPQDAYAYFAKRAVRADGSSIGVTRVQTYANSPSSYVRVYVATASGGVTGTVGDVSTDLGAVDYTIQTKVVPTGTTAEIFTAAAHPIIWPITVYLSRLNTRTPTEVKQAVLDLLTSYYPTTPIGGFDIGAGGRIFVAAIIGQVFRADENIVEVTIPAADEVLTENEVATSGNVIADITVVQLTA